MGFVFKLDALLELRRHAEKERQRAVAQVQQEVNGLRRQIQQTQVAIAQQNRTLVKDKLVGILDMPYIAYEKRFVGNLQMLLVQTMQKLAGVEQKLAAARGQLLEATKARKVIEKLREKQHARWQQEQDRRENLALDELGTQVALRGLRED